MALGVKVTTGALGVRRGGIAELVDVETVFARGEAGELGFNPNAAGGLGESDDAGNPALRGRMNDGYRLGDVARLVVRVGVGPGRGSQSPRRG